MFKKICSVFIIMALLCGAYPAMISAGMDVNGEEVIKYARQWIGRTPYVYGGNSLTKGTDCSGFICLIYEEFGINIWSARGDVMKLVSSGLATNVGTNINNAKPGDIVRYSGHVALYSGNGKVIHAVSSKWDTLETSVSWIGKPVQAIIRLNSTAADSEKSLQNTKSVPAVPAGLKAERTGSTTAKISWGAVSGADNYYVEYKSQNTSNKWIMDTDYSSSGIGNSTSYTVTRLGNYTYEFRVHAINSAGKSGWSNILSYTHSKTAAKTCTIAYNANGGSGAPGSHSVTKDSGGVASFNLSSKKPERSGYTFLGWRLEDNTAYGIDNPGASIIIQLDSSSIDETLTYYAQWKITPAETKQGKAIIEYDANGGSGAPGNHSVTKNSGGVASFSLSSKEPERSGYTFLGWRLEDNTAYGIDNPGAGIIIQLDSSSIDETLTYYAQWKITPSEVKQGKAIIEYNANGGSGAPGSHSVTKDSGGIASFNLSSKKPERSGYIFQGWRLENDTAYGIDDPGASISIQLDSSSIDETLTYYAQWIKLVSGMDNPGLL